MDVIAGLPDCDGQAADATSAYTRVKMEDAIPKSECPDVWKRLPRHKWPKSWANIEDSVVPLERNLYGHPLACLQWERQFDEVLLGLAWEKVPNWVCLFVHRKQELFLLVDVDDIEMAGKKQSNGSHVEEFDEHVGLDEPISSLDHVRDALHVNANRTAEKLPGWEKPRAKTAAWHYDMEGHAQQCVERHCKLANKKDRASVQSLKSLPG